MFWGTIAYTLALRYPKELNPMGGGGDPETSEVIPEPDLSSMRRKSS